MQKLISSRQHIRGTQQLCRECVEPLGLARATATLAGPKRCSLLPLELTEGLQSVGVAPSKLAIVVDEVQLARVAVLLVA